MHTSRVAPTVKGFVSIIRNPHGVVVAMTLPTADRNKAARDGMTVRATLAGL